MTARRINVPRIMSKMVEKGYGTNMKRVSKDAGLAETALRDLVTPGRPGFDNPTPRKMKAIGKVLDLTISEMVFELAPPLEIPVIGFVSAGDGWHPVDDDSRETATFVVDDGAIAVHVRGDSMSPVYRSGDLIIAVRRAGANVENLVGLDCVIELKDRQRFVKTISACRKGRCTLRSYMQGFPDMIGADVAWAAPVIWVRRGSR